MLHSKDIGNIECVVIGVKLYLDRDTMEDEHIGVEFSDWPDLGYISRTL